VFLIQDGSYPLRGLVNGEGNVGCDMVEKIFYFINRFVLAPQCVIL
jgi:hypothetical protein